MNKTQLQQELLKKVKPGVKPSDLKKQRGNDGLNLTQAKNIIPTYSNHGIPTPPPTPPLKPKQEKTFIPPMVPEPEPTQQELLAKIKELQEQNKSLRENITNQENQAKTQQNIKETKEIGTQTESTYFYCDNCQQNKHGSYIIRKIDSPFEPRTHKKLCYICSSCQKYTKEYNEKENWKEEDNPYKLYD